MTFVDAGHLIGLVDASDDLSRRARAWTVRCHEPLLTTNYVAIEAFNHFSASRLRERSHLAIGRFLAQPGVEVVHVDPALHKAGLAPHHGRPDKPWSLTD